MADKPEVPKAVAADAVPSVVIDGADGATAGDYNVSEPIRERSPFIGSSDGDMSDTEYTYEEESFYEWSTRYTKGEDARLIPLAETSLPLRLRSYARDVGKREDPSWYEGEKIVDYERDMFNVRSIKERRMLSDVDKENLPVAPDPYTSMGILGRRRRVSSGSSDYGSRIKVPTSKDEGTMHDVRCDCLKLCAIPQTMHGTKTDTNENEHRTHILQTGDFNTLRDTSCSHSCLSRCSQCLKCSALENSCVVHTKLDTKKNLHDACHDFSDVPSNIPNLAIPYYQHDNISSFQKGNHNIDSDLARKHPENAENIVHWENPFEERRKFLTELVTETVALSPPHSLNLEACLTNTIQGLKLERRVDNDITMNDSGFSDTEATLCMYFCEDSVLRDNEAPPPVEIKKGVTFNSALLEVPMATHEQGLSTNGIPKEAEDAPLNGSDADENSNVLSKSKWNLKGLNKGKTNLASLTSMLLKAKKQKKIDDSLSTLAHNLEMQSLSKPNLISETSPLPIPVPIVTIEECDEGNVATNETDKKLSQSEAAWLLDPSTGTPIRRVRRKSSLLNRRPSSVMGAILEQMDDPMDCIMNDVEKDAKLFLSSVGQVRLRHFYLDSFGCSLILGVGLALLFRAITVAYVIFASFL